MKIIDKSQDAAMQESIMAEVDILGRLPAHPNISERRFTSIAMAVTVSPAPKYVAVGVSGVLRCGLHSTLTPSSFNGGDKEAAQCRIIPLSRASWFVFLKLNVIFKWISLVLVRKNTYLH